MRKSVLIFSLFACTCSGTRVQTSRKVEDGVPPESLPQASLENVPLKSLAAMLAGASPASAFQAPTAAGSFSRGSRGAAVQMSAPADVSDLKDLAKKLNPAVGYFDPLQLGKADFYEQGNEATKGFLRHSEIKHGRVAMAAFVGYCAQSNGINFPWKLTGDISFADIAAAGSPPEQWDALPTASKLQILLFIGFLEFWSESSNILKMEGNAHYMRGGKPGAFPSFDAFNVHPVPFDLYDPLNLNSKKSREVLDKSLLAEVNNGRLAMLGIMSLLSEQKVPGAVPALKSIAPNLKQYAGEIMAPFAAGDASYPYVEKMLANAPTFPLPMFVK